VADQGFLLDAALEQKQGPEELGKVRDELVDRDTGGDDGVERGQGCRCVFRDAGVDDLVDPVDTDEPKLVPDLLESDRAVGKGRHLVKECIRIAHATRRLAGDPKKRLLLGLDPAFAGRLGEGVPKDLDPDEAEVKLLASALDGRRDLVKLGRREDEDDVGRRLLDRL